MSKKPKHILVIRLSAMGDVAMTVPVLKALTTQYPEVKLTVLTKTLFTPFFRNLPNTQVVVADIKNQHKGIYGLWKLLVNEEHLCRPSLLGVHRKARIQKLVHDWRLVLRVWRMSR